MHLRDVHVQHVSGLKSVITIFTTMDKHAREVDVLYVLPDIAFITAHFTTKPTDMGFRPSFWILVDVVIQLLSISIYQMKTI